MEIFEENKTHRVSFSSDDDDSQRTLKPFSEQVQNEAQNRDFEAEKSQNSEVSVSVVKMFQEDKEKQKEGIGIDFGAENDKGVKSSVLSDKNNEIEKNQRNEVFGEFVGGNSKDDLKVKCSGNGISLVVDVKGSLGGENGNESKPVLKDDSGSLGVETDVEACLLGEMVKEREYVGLKSGEIDVNLSTGETGDRDDNGCSEKSTEFDGEKGEIEDESDGKDDEGEDHEFVVGDFVWGKIKSHPWWPGQIYDPSDASEYASKVKSKGRLLVAYFGDGSFSWCSQSQLKPFSDHFDEMSKQSSSKNFVNAVQMALDAVSKLVEAELMCKCQTIHRIDNASVANSGIKVGVPVPKGTTIKALIDRMEPLELLSTLKCSAAFEPTVRTLELTVLRSCLTAFYRQKGVYFLPEFHEPKCIEGLEDKIRTGTVTNSDINGPIELHQVRKQKSVAELLAGVEDEPKPKRLKTSKDGASGTKSLGTKSPGTKRERKRKEIVPTSPETDGVEDETISSPRQRKKSKYLSPPYTTPIWSTKSLASLTKEAKFEIEKHPESGTKSLELSSPPVKKNSIKTSRGKGEKPSDTQNPDAAVDMKKVMHGLFCVARDPLYSIKKKRLEVITEFMSSYRSSMFKEGPRSSGKRGLKRAVKEESEVEFVKKKLEKMICLLNDCEDGEIDAKVKAGLEKGVKEVLEKVSNLG